MAVHLRVSKAQRCDTKCGSMQYVVAPTLVVLLCVSILLSKKRMIAAVRGIFYSTFYQIISCNIWDFNDAFGLTQWGCVCFVFDNFN